MLNAAYLGVMRKHSVLRFMVAIPLAILLWEWVFWLEYAKDKNAIPHFPMLLINVLGVIVLGLLIGAPVPDRGLSLLVLIWCSVSIVYSTLSFQQFGFDGLFANWLGPALFDLFVLSPALIYAYRHARSA